MKECAVFQERLHEAPLNRQKLMRMPETSVDQAVSRAAFRARSWESPEPY